MADTNASQLKTKQERHAHKHIRNFKKEKNPDNLRKETMVSNCATKSPITIIVLKMLTELERNLFKEICP